MENILKDLKTKEIIKEKLEKFTEEERKFIIFKFFLEEEVDEEIWKIFSKLIKNSTSWCFYCNEMSELRKTNIQKSEKLKKVARTEEDYKEILRKTKLLSQELKLNNSLEISNLFTYLLWNGYFSKDKRLNFQSHDRLLLSGAYSQDIMNGHGVCLNFSDMLTDLLNEYDFSAATILNKLPTKPHLDYRPDIERNRSKKKLSNSLIRMLLIPIMKNFPNHAFNLIKENNGLYIYDSTNLFISNLTSKNESIIITGVGKIKLYPYFSYYINLDNKPVETLDFLHTTTNYESPYTKSDFIDTWEECLLLFTKNMGLLNDFYDEIYSNINKITEENKDVKQKLKNKNTYKIKIIEKNK